MLRVYFVLFQVWIFLDVCLARGSYLLLAPKQLRVGTDHDVIISATGLTSEQRNFRIFLTNNHSPRFSEKTFSVDNDEAKNVTVRVNAEDVPAENFVTLHLESVDGSVVNHTTIPVIRNPGYIYIQTDKPIYTPRQTVRYHVVALDEDQSWAPWKVQIDIINPNGILDDRIALSSKEAFEWQNFSLSRDPVLGKWKIIASYERQVLTENSVTFEVKEYVLPQMKLRLTSNPTAMYFDEISPLTLTLEARTLYNKPVDASVKLKLLAFINNGTVILIDNLHGKLNSSGLLEMRISERDLENSLFENDMEDTPLQFGVQVTATEESSANEVVKVFKSAKYTEEKFVCDIIDFKQYYKADTEYVYSVMLSRHDGKSVAGQEVYCTVGGHKLHGTVDSTGFIKFIFKPPPGKHFSFQFEVGDRLCYNSHNPTQERTGLNESVSIQLNKRPKAGKTLSIKVKFSNKPAVYYLLVVTRGKVIYQQTGSDEKQTIPASVTKQMSPLSRIVVFYFARQGSVTEIVTDAITVHMGNTCKEELRLNIQSRRPAGDTDSVKPRGKATVSISGGPGMTVTLFAVDRAVYAMDPVKSLTRKLIFEQLKQHDLGKKGDSSAVDALHTLLNAGFSVMTNADIAFPVTTVFKHSWTYNHDDVDEIAMSYQSQNLPLLRTYFPESWLFQETVLNDSGTGKVEITYPDSITTWVIQAVGVSAQQGVCVSPSKKVVVFQDFFVYLSLPYKAIRLEEIKPRVTVVNYKHFNLTVSISVSGSQGLCFPDKVVFTDVVVPSNSQVTRQFSVIPVMAGEHAVDVNVVEDVRLSDSVRKTLHVVTEGEEKEKTITFNLVPQGTVGHTSSKKGVFSRTTTFSDNFTVKHTVNVELGEQKTDIDLALPDKTIPGSEKFRVLASGDLLGGVINNIFINDGDEDDDEEISGESVMVSVSPAVFGFTYLFNSNDLDQSTIHRGQNYIKKGLTNLLDLRVQSGGFKFSSDSSEPSTWFTAFVLHTLCTAKHVTFINQDIINTGFSWLLSQVGKNIKMPIQERDGRNNELFQMSDKEKNVMLGAEILIAFNKCSFQVHPVLMYKKKILRRLLLKNVKIMNRPLGLAKVAYALYLTRHNRWKKTSRQLFRRRNITPDGLLYWADVKEEKIETMSFYSQDQVTADAVEATSYALLLSVLFKMNPKPLRCFVEPDRVAEWIIKWRNSNGVFVSATDTAIATLALAKYRDYKNIEHTNLTLLVSNTEENFKKSLQFDDDSALYTKTVPEVPPVSKLLVVAGGVGLGQMHIDAKYNVHVDKESLCLYNVTVDRYSARKSLTAGFDLCAFCGMGCNHRDKKCKKKKTERTEPRKSFSSEVHCLKICIKHKENYKHGVTVVDINMVTGFEPVACDLQMMVEGSITSAKYNSKKAKVKVILKEVSYLKSHCFGFRITRDTGQILRPASVIVRENGQKSNRCHREYNVSDTTASLTTLCSNPDPKQYRGVCSCVTSTCAVEPRNITLRFINEVFKRSNYTFILRPLKVTFQGDMKLVTFSVLEVMKQNVNQHLDVGREVQFLTFRYCRYPDFKSGHFYLVTGKKMYPRKQKDGSMTIHHWIDDGSFVLGDDDTIKFNLAVRNFNRIKDFYK